MYIKGFDENLKCRGFQYEIGKTYDTGASDDELELCTNTVFHFCDSLQKVHEFYNAHAESKNRYCEVEPLGRVIADNEKYGTNKIKIVREITNEELDILKGLINGNAGLFNSGDFNSGDDNSGDDNSGYGNSGDFNSGDFNSGRHNSGKRNSGNHNSGDFNSGNRNNGQYNSGHHNSGDDNSGNHNSGDGNSGDFNSGDFNSGIFNSCDYSAGAFCTEEPKVRLFNRKTDMTTTEFKRSKYYYAIRSSPFNLTEYREGGLVAQNYKEACAIWWENMTEGNREIIKSMPNFDAEIFKEITGIDITEEQK